MRVHVAGYGALGDGAAAVAARRGHAVALGAPEGAAPGTDLTICAGWRGYVTDAARGIPRLGVIGYHPSLLPLHRGRDAVRWAVKLRERVTGGTVYLMDAGADTGPVIAQDWCHVRPDDTPGSLWERELLPMGVRLIEEALRLAESGPLPLTPQDAALATWEPPLGRRPPLSASSRA